MSNLTQKKAKKQKKRKKKKKKIDNDIVTIRRSKVTLMLSKICIFRVV